MVSVTSNCPGEALKAPGCQCDNYFVVNWIFFFSYTHTHTHTHTHTNLIEKGFKAVSAVLHHLMCRQDKMSKPQMRHRLQNPPWHVHVTCSRPDFHICRWRSWRWCLNIFKRDFGTTSSLVYVVKNLIILWEVRTSPVSFVANKTGIFKPEHDVFWTLTQQFQCTWKSPQKIEMDLKQVKLQHK